MNAMATQPAPTTTPAIDPTDVAFMAIGAAAAIEKLEHDKRRALIEHFDGQIGIIDDVIRHAGTLSTIFDELEDGFPGVWAYEVAEPFGQRYVEALALDFTVNPEQLVRTLISEV
jgi:hypothetical protein